MILPAYNEGLCIGRTLLGVRDTLDSSGIEYEVILVNDGSTDDTFAQAIAEAGESTKVKVLGYHDNQGKGHAVKYGFEHSRGDLVMFLDADSDLPPRQMPLLLESMADGGVDVVVGSKLHPCSEVVYPLTRRICSRAYQSFVRILFGLRVSDTQTGIKLFRREVLSAIFPKVLVKRYAFDLELLVNAQRLGYRIAGVPVLVQYNFSSRISLSDISRIFLDTLAIFYRLRLLHYYDRDQRVYV